MLGVLSATYGQAAILDGTFRGWWPSSRLGPCTSRCPAATPAADRLSWLAKVGRYLEVRQHSIHFCSW